MFCLGKNSRTFEVENSFYSCSSISQRDESEKYIVVVLAGRCSIKNIALYELLLSRYEIFDLEKQIFPSICNEQTHEP